MKATSYDDVVIFVDAANNLAESLRNDISKGPEVSTATVLFLSKFYIAAMSLEALFDKINDDKNKIN